MAGEISREDLRRRIWAELGFDEPSGDAADAASRRVLFDSNLRDGVRALGGSEMASSPDRRRGRGA